MIAKTIKNYAKFAAWAQAHASGVDIYAAGADYSAQYLLNVDATASVSLAVVSASMAEGGFSVRVRALANGAAVDAAAINGLVHVSAGALERKSLPAGSVTCASGEATILVPRALGNFVRVEIDD